MSSRLDEFAARLFSIPETAIPRSRIRRMLASSLWQSRRTLRAPDVPRLDGKLAIVTGATGGIGVEIARGLARRGAELILPCRNPARGARMLERLRSEISPAIPIHMLELELEDLDSVRACARAIETIAAGRSIEVLVENAGIWPQRYARTRQGHEIAFGVNVLAHFALRRELLRSGRLQDGRVVILTGDIYILQSECTADYVWSGPLGGMRAYCRSKLGNLWIASELQRRFPRLAVCSVHPGVVATDLGGRAGPLGDRLRRIVMIDPELGAQTPLLCATQGGLEQGGYYHNTCGRVLLPPDDPALDLHAAARLWDLCDSLASA